MQLPEVIRRYLIWRRAMGTSPRTLPNLVSILKHFTTWAQDRDVTTIEQLTPDLFSAYQQELTFRLNRHGRPIVVGTQLQHLGVLRTLGRYLVEQDFLISDPTLRLRLPRQPKSLPRVIPDVDEAIRLMATRTGEPLSAYRDQAILELLYSTGLRRSEVAHLNVGDLDLIGGYCWVREGKGKKDRVVPLGKMAIKSLQIYLDAVRPVLLKGQEHGALFLNRRGGRLSGQGIYDVVKRAVTQAKLSRKITPHALRHAAATHMLKNGAPLRHLQEFLGHACVETTQVYTRITIPELKAIHAKYHPREQGTE
jgi:integrase/recombinase XerD